MFFQKALVLLVGLLALYIQLQQVDILNTIASMQAANTQYLEGRINNVAAELSDFELRTRQRLDVLDAKIRLNH